MKKHALSALRAIGGARELPYIALADGVRRRPNNQPFTEQETMAKTAKKAAPKKAVKKVATKAAAKPAAPKPIKEVLTKSGLVAHIAEASGVVAKDVRAVLASLESAVASSVHKKGSPSVRQRCVADCSGATSRAWRGFPAGRAQKKTGRPEPSRRNPRRARA